jgi:membrane-bound serine protease (ClpP class)
VTGREGLVGQVALVRSRLNPEGTVFVKGELWHATALEGPIAPGEEVEIVAAEGFNLEVKRVIAGYK